MDTGRRYRLMRYPLFDAAHALHAALKELIATHPGGAANPETLHRLRRLCVAARLTMPDAECRAAIRDVETYALALYADQQHGNVDHDLLRARILSALSAFQSRLRAIENETASPPPLSGRARARDQPAS